MTIDTEELRKLLDEATPGPWDVVCDESSAQVKGFPCIVTDNYTVVGSEGMYGDIDVDYSNARLIAAAPDLAAEVIRLREALEPFAAAMQWIDAERYDDDDHPSWAEFFKIGDFRRADAALNHKETDIGTS